MSALSDGAAKVADLLSALAPYTQSLLRIAVGFLLIPHGMRVALGFFNNTGLPTSGMSMFIRSLDESGYRPGWLWAWLISGTHLVCGPLMVIGLWTQLAAIPVVIFLFVACFERWRVGGWFWNQLGVEYTLLWLIAGLHVLVAGPGPLSVDHVLGLVRP